MKKIIFASMIVLGLSQSVLACSEKNKTTSTDDQSQTTTVASTDSNSEN